MALKSIRTDSRYDYAGMVSTEFPRMTVIEPLSTQYLVSSAARCSHLENHFLAKIDSLLCPTGGPDFQGWPDEVQTSYWIR